jgi:hypothetical protein
LRIVASHHNVAHSDNSDRIFFINGLRIRNNKKKAKGKSEEVAHVVFDKPQK